MATSVRLNTATEQRLDRLAAETGRSKAYYLRELIERGLEDLEDQYLAAATMERVRGDREAVFSASEVRGDLGLED